MKTVRSLLILLLSTSVLASTTVCACEALGSQIGSGSDLSGHSHHQHHADMAVVNADSLPGLSCLNLDCDGCEPGVLVNERESVVQLDEQDDSTELVLAFPRADHKVNRAIDWHHGPPLPRQTPLLRYDVSLQ